MHRIELAAEDVHRFVAQRVANPADAADISQETLLRACVKLHTFRGHRIHGWLFAIAETLIADYDRSRQIDLVTIDAAAGAETETALQIPAAAVDGKCDLRLRVNRWLRRCGQLLQPGQQVAVMLADVYEYDDRDSAAMLRMSVPSFKLLLHRSRARLKAFEAVAASSRVSVRIRKPGVICHLDRAELRKLRRTLLEGLRLATMALWTIADMLDLELLELLFDL
ncbi:MAG TPA: sigma factor [Vicinamibacterales bacterium]|nr:sigma factor [Vicinamibacterales bacterium]